MADETSMNQGPAVPPQAKEDAKRGATHIHKAAEDLRSAAGATADKYRARGKEVWDDALHRVRNFQEGRDIAGNNRGVPLAVRSLTGTFDQCRARGADSGYRIVESRALSAPGTIAQDENKRPLSLHPVEQSQFVTGMGDDENRQCRCHGKVFVIPIRG